MKLLAVVLVLVPLAFGGIHRVWELRLNKINEPAGWETLKRHELQGIAFSPDGKLLAVTVGNHENATTAGTHVVVVDVATPRTSLRQYDVSTCGAPLEWSPGGHAILVCESVLEFPGGATCNVPELPHPNLPLPPALRIVHEFWRDSNHIVHIGWNGSASILDEDCRPQAATREEILSLERESRKTPSGWPPREFQHYEVVNTSTDGLRVLAELKGDIHGRQPVLRRVVWDVRTGREVAAWKPFKQPSFPAVFISLNNRSCALSPDGQLVAEGSDGVVRLYRLD